MALKIFCMLCFAILVMVFVDIKAEASDCHQDDAPSSPGLYIAHTTEPNESIYFCDIFWNILKTRARCYNRGLDSQEEGISTSSSLVVGIIKPVNETPEQLIFMPWFLYVLASPNPNLFAHINYRNQMAAYINSTHPSHIGKPEPIFVSDSFWQFLTGSPSSSETNASQCQSNPAMFVRNPGKPEEQIFMSEWFCVLWNFLHFT